PGRADALHHAGAQPAALTPRRTYRPAPPPFEWSLLDCMPRPRAARPASTDPEANPGPPSAARNAVSETSTFAPRATTEQVEEGRLFAPKFDGDGLITCVVTDAWSAEVLMVAHMNPDALAKTISTGEAWFYSRSRQQLWRKGETSGHTQRVIELRV